MERTRRAGMLAAFLAIICCACAPVGRPHAGREPVSWSIAEADSAKSPSDIVCESGSTVPCVLERSTADDPNYASVVLHLWSPTRSKFSGFLEVGFLDDPDPRKYRSPVELTSADQDVHHRLFTRITTVPGTYTVRIQLEELMDGAPPRRHELSIPVTVTMQRAGR